MGFCHSPEGRRILEKRTEGVVELATSYSRQAQTSASSRRRRLRFPKQVSGIELAVYERKSDWAAVSGQVPRLQELPDLDLQSHPGPLPRRIAADARECGGSGVKCGAGDAWRNVTIEVPGGDPEAGSDAWNPFLGSPPVTMYAAVAGRHNGVGLSYPLTSVHPDRICYVAGADVQKDRRR